MLLILVVLLLMSLQNYWTSYPDVDFSTAPPRENVRKHTGAQSPWGRRKGAIPSHHKHVFNSSSLNR